MIKLLSMLAIVLACTTCYAQDILTMKSGEDISGKVIEVNTTSVKYKKFDAQDGPIYEVLKSDLVMIRYEDGTKDIFSTSNIALSDNAELYTRGQRDAAIYYKGYKSAGTGTFVVGLLSPLAGLIPAIACASTTPKDKNLDYPDSDLMQNPDYHRGYVQAARKIKRNKVWKNWGITLGINFVAALALQGSH